MKLKVFLSWSGNVSHAIAGVLHKFLPEIIQNLEPFISSKIEKGSAGLDVIDSELEGSHFGILCLTPENTQSVWIHYEAGALSKMVERRKIIPLLYQLSTADIHAPLSKYQAVKNFDQQEMFEMVKSLNSGLGPEGLAPDRLKSAFDRVYPEFRKELDETIKKIPTAPKESRKAPDKNSAILEELLAMTRNMDLRISEIEQGSQAANLNPHRSIAQIRPSSPSPAWLTPETVIEVLSKLPDIDPDEMRARAQEATGYLMQRGIRTKEELIRMVNAENVWTWLRSVYKTELLRDKEFNLDPLAVAAWGPALYMSGLSEPTKQGIIHNLRNSPEYRKKHPGAAAANIASYEA